MRNFTQIEQQEYDVIVIGGGINGAGVARDAALRGLKTILLEKSDFASGSSSWSSRLIHGGLRYLEYFEFPLVREALKEREVLFNNAPHLVDPLLLTIPVYSDRSRPYWKIWAGMILYDIFSYDKTVPIHRMLPLAKFKQLFRAIDEDGLAGGAQYYDGQVALAERLCLENIIAAKEAGADVINYSEVTELKIEGSKIKQLICKDRLTEETFTVTGSPNTVVINTAGPWVDKVCQRGSSQGDRQPIGKTRKMGGTKGSHIIVDRFPGTVDEGFYVEAKSDGRPFFILPWLDKYLIGTTDLPFKGDLDRIKANDEEVDYLIQETNNIFPNANLSRKDVLFTYSGVRPLPNEEGKKPGSITRKHILHDHTKEGVSNLISLIGGKLTTYRNVGEEMIDVALKKMGRKPQPCKTDKIPLPGCIVAGDRRIHQAISQYQDRLAPDTINYLFSIYGARAVNVLALTQENLELATNISPNLPDIKAQIVYAVKEEMAHNLVDIIRRRTTLAMNGNYGLDLLPVVTETLRKYCGWSQEKCDRSSQEYRTFMEENCIPDYQLKDSLVASY
ncbi:Glycerol-3-phosphate dehydrogenase [Hyella patelloides LEGE 07179]|uniref:Glycerol-3-phosphate dehydrogenase n=1 Tax=Hyella patelloides LEGE 07179 TaxID=945734 RepID=A0A563VTL2_9CYAN|nr:glycerol-3-phosphate dehydrogenase [Hyella patelloides]VEP14787.1 Glycerol-3-phosphate dehydrogenase [Hyella patelloides LEGE 07179]